MISDKTSVLLVQAPFWATTSTSLALGYITSNLKKKNRDVKQINLNLELLQDKKVYDDLWMYMGGKHAPINDLNFLYPDIFGKIDDERYDQLLSLAEEWSDRIIKLEPKIIGFSIHDSSRLISLLMAKRIKERNNGITIVFGGEECEQEESGRFIIRTGFVDALIVGEGEETMNEFVTAIEEKKAPNEIPGTIVRKSNGDITVLENRRLNFKLSEFKYPEFNQEDLKRSDFPFMVPMTATRGCVANCTFCTEVVYWKVFRFRKLDNIINEIKYHKKVYGAKAIRFNDSLINGNMKLLTEFCDRLIKEKLDITWLGNARFDKGLTYEFLKKMYDSGCRELMFGMETGSQDVLELMKKKTDIEINNEILDNAKNLGIWCHTYVLTGFPNEEPKDFMETINFLGRNHDKISDFSLGALYITDYNYIFKHQKEFNISFSKIKDFPSVPKEYAFTKFVKHVYKDSNNKNFNDGIRRSLIVESIFNNYITKRDYREKFLENKPFSGPRSSLLVRPIISNNNFYSPDGNEEFHICRNRNDINKGANYLKLSISSLNEKFTKKVCEIKPKKLFLRFIVKEADFQIKTGEAIIAFLDKLQKYKIEYMVTKPLPRCLFGNKYEFVTKEYNIPKDCRGCVEFLKIENNELVFCKNCEISDLNQTASFNTCNTCIHKIRNTCNGFCL